MGYEIFEALGKAEFGYEKRYMYRLAEAAEIEQSLMLPDPKSGLKATFEIPETQLRPLATVPEQDRAAIWKEATEKALAENAAVFDASKFGSHGSQK